MEAARLSRPAPAEGEPLPSARRQASATLLVVDDNEMNREVLSRFFESKGYNVVVAEDGREALRVDLSSVDVVLLDIMMPEVSGLEVLRAIRGRRSVAELPVVMLTAKDQSEDLVEALRLGANDYVVKPPDFEVVLARVETQLSLKRAMAEIRRLAEKLEMRNRFIQRTFGRYLSDEVVAGLLEGPEGLKLGGEKRTVTLLMSDLRGFTALAERLTPEQVLRLLNNYLGGMAEVILRHQGTIDEFVGDAIMALFGAPVARPDDALRASACAIAMQLAMAEVNEKNRADGLPDVEMGVAVNTGEVIVGNIGSEMRAKYGVVGVNVNLASRIQSFTLGGQVLISESTLQNAGAALRVGEPVSLHPKGFQEPILVYDLLGIGGGHDLVLPERPDELLPLAREIPIAFCVLHGKHLQGPGRQGRLVKASERGALIQASRSVAPLSNLRIRLNGSGAGEIYAKVLGCVPTEPGAFRVRFTSSSPEVQRLIQRHLVAEPVS